MVAMRSVFKFPIYFMPDVFHKVLPFHMARGMQAMKGNVHNCDCVIEMMDARVPLSSANLEFEYLYAGKPRIILFNKIDIADRKKTEVIVKEHFDTNNVVDVLYTNSKEKKTIKKVMPLLRKVFMERSRQLSIQRGKPVVNTFLDRSFRVLICGIPNVGKSSFINHTRQMFTGRGGKATPVGKKPGVTRSVMQSILISKSPRIMILDTPGILSPKIKNEIVGMRLALTGTFPDHVIGEEVIADYLLFVLNQQHNYSYVDFCGLREATDDFDEVVSALSTKHNFMKSAQGYSNYRRSSLLLINAFRSNLFGKITLDEVNEK